MTSRRIVFVFAIGGIILLIVYYFATGDTNLWPSLVATVFGLCVGLTLVYQIVERKISEERRARLKAVEDVALEGVLSYSNAVVRRIGMFAGVRDLEPQLDENASELAEKLSPSLSG